MERIALGGWLLVLCVLFVVWLLGVRGVASDDVRPAVPAGVPASRARG